MGSRVSPHSGGPKASRPLLTRPSAWHRPSGRDECRAPSPEHKWPLCALTTQARDGPSLDSASPPRPCPQSVTQSWRCHLQISLLAPLFILTWVCAPGSVWQTPQWPSCLPSPRSSHRGLSTHSSDRAILLSKHLLMAFEALCNLVSAGLIPCTPATVPLRAPAFLVHFHTSILIHAGTLSTHLV